MDAPVDTVRHWLRAMPKAELHLHLDGSMRLETALALAGHRGLDDGPSPTTITAIRERLVAPPECRDQADLLRRFDLPIALLQDAEALERVTAELVEDVASDGTRYAEIRWAPALHTRRGLSLAGVIGAVTQGAHRAAAAHGVTIRLIAVALRTHAAALAIDVAAAAVRALPDGVTGFDLAGIERDAPDPGVFAEAFETARSGGLGITCHAGEWGGAAQVWRALGIEPWRIAHGAPTADDPGLMAEVRRRGVTLDLCPTSNQQAGIWGDGPTAPLPRLVRADVPVTLSTDDRTVSDITLVDELDRAMRRWRLTGDDIVAVTRRAYTAAFLHHDEAIRVELRHGFESWLAQHPAP